MRRFLSIFLVLVLTLSAPVGATSAFAEQPAVEGKPLTQTLPSGALEGGHSTPTC